MRRPWVRRQSGQALILVAVASLLLTALLALALDGGRIYLDRRQLQNAADAGALAGAEKLQVLPYPSFASAHTLAMQTIVKNLPGTSAAGYVAPSAQSGANAYSIGAGYEVTLYATPTTYQATVAHVMATVLAPVHGFASTVQDRAQATAQNGNLPFALVLLQYPYSPSFKNLTLNGFPESLTLMGGGGAADRGGVYSNASADLGQGTINFGGNPPSCPNPPGTGNSGEVWTVWPTTLPSAQVNCPQSLSQAHQTSILLADPAYPEPPAPSLNLANGATVLNGGTTYLCPGQYGNKILIQSGGVGVLLPGAFHVQAGGVSVGGTLRTLQPGDPNPVLAAQTNCNTDWWWGSDVGAIVEITPANASGQTNCSQHQFSAAAGSTVNLQPSPQYLNISIYVETMPNWQTVCSQQPTGTNVVAITGGATYSIYGAIYGPADNMQIGGGGGGWGVGQIIAWTMKITGNGNVNETYDPTRIPYIKGLIQ